MTTSTLTPEAEWRDLDLLEMVDSGELDLTAIFVRKIEPSGIRTFGDLRDHLVAGGDFSGIAGFESAHTTAQIACSQYAVGRDLENFESNGQAPAAAETSEVSEETEIIDTIEETVEVADSDIKLLRREIDELRKAMHRRDNEHEHYVEIQNKQLWLRGLVAEEDDLKEQYKAAKKRREAGDSELRELISNSQSPQMQLQFEGRTRTVVEETGFTVPEGADFVPVQEGEVILETDDEETKETEPAGWTSDNYLNAPIVELDLTDKQLEATQALGVSLLRDLELELAKQPSKVQKRVKDKFLKWIELHNITRSDVQPADAFTEPPSDTAEAASEPSISVIPQPGRPKRIQLTCDVPEYEHEGLLDGTEHDVIRHLGTAPIVAGTSGTDYAILSEDHFDVLEEWPEE